MPRSRVFALLSLVALTVFLAACGSENESDPTPAPTGETVATVAPTVAATSEATVDAGAASPAAVDSDSDSTPVASPVTEAPAVAIASPADDAAAPVVASPVAEPAATTPTDATFVLGGTEQRDYMLTEEGCYGLGEWSQLKPGAQVIVRDASGTVVDIATLEPGEDTGECSWNAGLSVTDSEFVSISIPMVTEVWFSQPDLESGNVRITFP